MFRPPRTLLWRLCLALVSIQVLVAVIFGTHAYRSAKAFHHQQTEQELKRLVSLLEPLYREFISGDEPGSERFADVISQLRASGSAGSVRITLIDAAAQAGQIMADTHSDPAAMDNHLDRPEVQQAMSSKEAMAVRFSDSVDMAMMYCAKHIEHPGGGVVVRAAVPMTRVNADLQRLLITLGTAGAGLLVVTVILTYIVSRGFSRTISSLSAQAVDLASDEHSTPIEEPSSRELAPLAHALNDLAARLHQRITLLQTQQREHEAILQSMSSGVIALDGEQRIVRMNRAAESILASCLNVAAKSSEPRRTTGRLLQEVVRSEALNQYVQSVISEGSHGPVELRLRSQPELVVQVSSSPLHAAAASNQGVLVVLNDITPLRRLESLRSDFAANVSHELRTPITNIKGYVETMLDVGVDDQEQSLRFLDIIKRNSDRLAAIIEDILSLAWLEQPGTRKALVLEPTDAKHVIDAITSQFENAAEAKGIVLVTQVAEGLAAPMNQQLIEQALSNYVSNAIKYSPPDTTVTISAQPDEAGWIVFQVADEGYGIASEHLPRVFERFYRVDKARSRELGGTGLGLAIVKHISLVHGGRVEVQSALGKGSVFRLILPSR